MTKKASPENLLFAFDSLKDDLLTEAENADKRTSVRRLGRICAVAAAILLLCAIPVISSYIHHVRLFSDGEEEAGSQGALYDDILYYDGMYYSYAGTYPGEYRDRLLGKVEINLRSKTEGKTYDPASGIAAATIVPVGARLWSADGWDEGLFICTESRKWGSIDVYSRKLADADQKFPTLPESGHPNHAVLSGSGDGVISDHALLSEIADILVQSLQPYEEDIPAAWNRGKQLSVTLYYDTPFGISVTLFENPLVDGTMIGCWLGNCYFSSPEGLFEHLYDNTVYRGGEELLSYGGMNAYRDPYCFLPEFDEKEYGYQTYLSTMFRVKNGTLYVCSAYDGMETSALVPLAEHVRGCIRAEYENVYYLREDGAAAYLKFEYPNSDIPDFSERVRSGEDMCVYVTEEEILYPGPYEFMQVRDGIVWGLSSDGTLYRNGEFYQNGVLCFAIDPDGVSYGTDSGLFRDSIVTGKTCLWNGRVNAILSCGYTLYFGTDKELRRICVDGSTSEKIGKIQARSLYAPLNGSEVIPLTAVDVNGSGWIVYQIDGVYYLFRIPGLADSVECFGSTFCVRCGDEIRYDDIYLSWENFKTAEYYCGGYVSDMNPEILHAVH